MPMLFNLISQCHLSSVYSKLSYQLKLLIFLPVSSMQSFIVNHQMFALRAQELKRFEEIHRSTQPRSALAAAFALPAQGRCADRIRRLCACT
jgi:hypothetical protein